jgi:hypothetical protein
VVQIVDLRPDPFGVGVVELGEDVEGLPPGIAGGIEVTAGVVSVAEVGEGGGFVEAVAEPATERQRVLASILHATVECRLDDLGVGRRRVRRVGPRWVSRLSCRRAGSGPWSLGVGIRVRLARGRCVAG